MNDNAKLKQQQQQQLQIFGAEKSAREMACKSEMSLITKSEASTCAAVSKGNKSYKSLV